MSILMPTGKLYSRPGSVFAASRNIIPETFFMTRSEIFWHQKRKFLANQFVWFIPKYFSGGFVGVYDMAVYVDCYDSVRSRLSECPKPGFAFLGFRECGFDLPSFKNAKPVERIDTAEQHDHC